MAASYPSSIKTFVTRVDGAGNIIFAAHMNDVQDEINAIETGLINGVQHVLRPDSSANNRDIGLTTARFRDLFAKGTIDVDQGTITADDPAWQSVATWNAAGVTFVHKDTNITDTASAAASILERWRVGGAIRFSIRKDGLLTVGGAGGGLDFTTGAAVRVGTTDAFDLILKRAATDKITIGATRTDFADNVRLPTNGILDTGAGTLTIGTQAAANLDFLVGAVARWRITSAGLFLPVTDNTVDIGSGTNRVRDVFVGTSVTVGTNVAATGAVRLANLGTIRGRNAANSGDIIIAQIDSSDRVHLSNDTADIVWGQPLVALGGGAAPTLGTIGGSGPATAAQNTWMRVIDTSGAAFWVPVWK